MDDMADEETFEHELAGRMMVFKKTSPTQMLALQRYAQQLKDKIDVAVEAEDEMELVKLVGTLNSITWETVESRFTDPDDLTFVQLKVATGILNEADLLTILTNGYKRPPEPDDDADPKPAGKKPVKKAAKATPAQRRKAANGRATR